MSDDLSQNTTEDRLLGQVADEFRAALARGETPSVGDYAKRYPAIASLLERTLPVVAMLNGSKTEQDRNNAFRPPKKLGDFQIIQQIGQGGMGVVFEAEQISMGRRVALKILPLGAMLDKTRLERFHLEVRAAATLDHPHCVPIYAVDEDQGIHFYAMKLIEGQTLAEVIKERKKGNTAETLPSDSISISRNSKSQTFFRQVAKLGIEAAEALHHAHERGVVHRDIKPSNLMLDAEGSIWITDFGLARIEADAGLTMTGDLLGTLRYMSPEQASGERALVGHQTDIYSLGVTLYELLALRPAVEGEDHVMISRNFADSEPPSLSKLVPSMPIELTTIISKSIEKKPSDRYATAHDLAADLGRFLRHEPILAKRSTPTERTIKWVRRHPTAASLIAVSLLALASVVGLSLRHASELGDLNVELEQSLNESVEQQSLMKHYVYTADISLAYQAWEDNDFRACHDLLLKHLSEDKAEPPGIEWRLLWRLSHPPTTTIDKIDSAIYDMDFSPQGDVYAVGGEDSVVRIYDTASDHQIDKFPTDQLEINSVDFSPDGQRLATAGDDGTVKIWRWSDHTLLTEFQAYAEKVDGAKYLPNGKSMITWGKNPSVFLWDLESGNKTGSFEDPVEFFESVHISADGKWLFAGDKKTKLTIFDIEQLKEIDFVKAGSRINCIAFAPKKKMFFAGTATGTVTGWHLGEKQPFFRIDRPDSIASMTIDSEENRLAFGDKNGVIQVCDLNDTSNVVTILAHQADVQSLHFSSDGKRLTSCSRDGQIKNYSLSTGNSPFFHTHRLEEPSGLNQLSVVGYHQVVEQLGGESNRLLMLDTNHLEEPVWKNSEATNFKLPFGTGKPGRYLVTRAYHNDGEKPKVVPRLEVQLLETNTGRVVSRWPWEREPRSIALSNEAKLYAVTYRDGNVQLIDIDTGKEVQKYELPYAGPAEIRVAFSPDGQLLACAQKDKVYLIDLQTKMVVRTLESHAGGVSTVEFSLDGSLLACGCHERSIQVWNIKTGQLIADLTGHLDQILNLQFLTNGRLLSSDAKGFALWDISAQRHYFYHAIGKHSYDLFESAENADTTLASVVVMPREDWLALAIIDQSAQFLKLDVSDVWPKR